MPKSYAKIRLASASAVVVTSAATAVVTESISAASTARDDKDKNDNPPASTKSASVHYKNTPFVVI